MIAAERDRRGALTERIRAKGNGHRRPVSLRGPGDLVVTGTVAEIVTDGVRMRGGVFVRWGSIRSVEAVGR